MGRGCCVWGLGSDGRGDRTRSYTKVRLCPTIAAQVGGWGRMGVKSFKS